MDAATTERPDGGAHTHPVVALVGNPNVGKTSLFNRLTDSLAKTSNFSGTTVELRTATADTQGQTVSIADLPGLFSLEPTSPEEQISRAFVHGDLSGHARPTIVVAVVDACNLERTLFVARQLKQLGVHLVVAVNMIDAARAKGFEIDPEAIQRHLDCSVILVSAKTGEGIDALHAAIVETAATATQSEQPPVTAGCTACSDCDFADGYRWAANVAAQGTQRPQGDTDYWTDVADRVLAHRIYGLFFFSAIMLVVFFSLFWVAQFPMALLDGTFGGLASWISTTLPNGLFADFLSNGVIAGIGSVLIFLPQICLLFFLLALLEDCGYLSRAVLVVDRMMRRVGLPGQAFVPLLAAHACAIPAIMSTRVIKSRRDRLAAILVIPLMTCSARLPVYSMIAAMLFPDQPVSAALMFAGAYCLGILAATVMAFLFRLTILPGTPKPLLIDLPPYRQPSLSKAFREAGHRSWSFIRDAGTVILAISIFIWALSSFPRLSDERFMQLAQSDDYSEILTSAAVDTESLRMQIAQEHSLLGRAGKFVQPVFEPLGFDWRTSVSVLASFAAREVVVSTMAVLYGAGTDEDSMIDRIRLAKHADGSAAIDTPTAIALLVFFVLAMQCLPTQAVTRKETGSWKWAIIQLLYMTALAYGVAFMARQACLLLA